MAPGTAKGLTTPTPQVDYDAALLARTTDQVHKIIDQHKVYDEPQRIQGNKILISMTNRSGRKINVQYFLGTLGPNIKKHGYDPLKAKDGFVILHTNKDKIAKLIQDNRKLAEGTIGIFPPIDDGEIEYECLDTSHLTTTFRCFLVGMVSSITGESFAPPQDDQKLKYVLDKGHRYWVLDDKLTDAEKATLADWRNSDQDSGIPICSQTSVVCGNRLQGNDIQGQSQSNLINMGCGMFSVALVLDFIPRQSITTEYRCLTTNGDPRRTKIRGVAMLSICRRCFQYALKKTNFPQGKSRLAMSLLSSPRTPL